MRLTYFAPYLPHDGIAHAGGSYFQHFLERLSRDHDVRLVVPDVAVNRAAQGMGPPAVRTRLVPLPRGAQSLPVRALVFPVDVLRGLPLGVLLLRAIRRDPVAEAWVEESDLVEIQWEQCLPLVPWLRRIAPSTPVTALEYDLLSQSFSRLAREAPTLLGRIDASVSLRPVARLERDLLSRCDAVFAFSEKDERLLRQLGVSGRVHIVDPYLAPVGGSAEGGEQSVLFVGAFGRAENAQGAMWFLDHVWPQVQAAMPSACVTLAGSDPPEALLARRSQSVRVTGYVTDLDPLYRAARVAVAPLLAGAGLKFKVPQAMLYGLPVVASPVAAEGIVDRSGPDAFASVSDDPGTWADTLLALLREPERAREVGRRAQAWAQRAFDFDSSVERVVEVYLSLLPRR